ncbi:hypothetical protein DIPPA_23429 [Diplonema papillatum]|nr:hypothetical protein DIPPA_23429 [Diplonema papillatum]
MTVSYADPHDVRKSDLPDAAWRERLAQLLKWATDEENPEGDIHFSLSCYAEASMLLYRMCSVRQPDGEVDHRLQRVAKKYLVDWTTRAQLLQSVVADGIPMSTHPLLKPVPGDADAASAAHGSSPLIDGALTFVTSATADPLLKSTAGTSFDTISPAPPSIPNAAASLDLPLPPDFGPRKPPAVLSEEFPDDDLSTNPFDGLPAGKSPKASDFARLFDTFLDKHSGSGLDE